VGSANEGSELSATRKYGRRHDKRELALPIREADAGSLRLGLCAGSVLNPEDRIHGAQLTARLTVGQSCHSLAPDRNCSVSRKQREKCAGKYLSMSALLLGRVWNFELCFKRKSALRGVINSKSRASCLQMSANVTLVRDAVDEARGRMRELR
jgi:hypothetical protein